MTKRALVAVAVILLMPVMASAATIAVSTFDASAEGWQVGELFDASGAAPPTFVASGGNPGGFIRTSEFSFYTGFQAPASFLGNQSAAYGGTLSLDSRVSAPVSPAIVTLFPLVTIGNGSLTLQYHAPTGAPTTSWTSFTVPLVETPAWTVATAAAPQATAAQLQAVLGALTFLNVDGNWHLAAGLVDLDNVRLCDAAGCGATTPTALPEPSALWLLGTGLVFIRRARRARPSN